MRAVPSILSIVLLSSVVLACSGNAVVEPASLTSKRAKAYLAKCQAPLPPDGTQLKMVYACIPAEDTTCPAKDDKDTKTELGYELNKGSACATGTQVYDVPCGPDLNAIECCYAVRTSTVTQGCD